MMQNIMNSSTMTKPRNIPSSSSSLVSVSSQNKSIGNESFVLYLEPILNTYFQSYQNVITFSSIPSGPLQEFVYTINAAKMSPFQSAAAFASPFYTGSNCVHVLLRYSADHFSWKDTSIFMGKDDIPAVFSYLLSNGYTINTELTKMMFHSRIDMGGVAESRLSGDRKMIAMVAEKHYN